MQRLIYIIAICTASFGFSRTASSLSFAELPPTTTIHIGKTADWVAITPDSVWVGSTGPNAVHRIDRKTNKLIATVKLPGEPCAGLATGFGFLWVPLCADSPVLSKVDLASNTLTSFPVSHVFAEGGVTTSSDSVWLVVDNGSLARVDPRSGKIRQIIRIPSGSYNPHYNANQIWITRAEGAEVSAIEAITGSITATVHTGPKPRFLTDGAGAIWTFNQGDGSLTRIDMKSRSTQSVALRTPGHGGDISFGGGAIWTIMRSVPLSATDAAKGELRCQWTGSGGDSLSVSDDAIWITDYYAGTISRIELKDALARCQHGHSGL